MKIKSLSVLCCLLATHFTFAALDANLLQKRWKIVSHNKKSKAVEHHENDFFQFNSSGSIEQVADGIYSTGKWSLNSDANILSLATAEGTMDWSVTELTAKTMKASYKNETLELEVVSLKFCHGDPYADLTMICGKWKVANHIAHYSRVAYSPNDYIQFFEDGTVEEVFKGKYRKMTWTYTQGKLQIDDITWKINALDPKQLKADITSKNETILLKKQ